MLNNIKKAIALILTLALSAVAMTACADKTQELLAFVDKGDFDGACDYYEENIKGTKRDNDIYDEFEEEIEDYYDDIIDKYFDEEYDDDDMEEFIELLDNMDVDTDDFDKEFQKQWEKYTEEEIEKYLMPNLVGMNIDDAKEEYPHLELNISSQEYSEYEEGIIYLQDVQENRPINEGQVVNVGVSKGAKIITIPDVSNTTSEAAVKTLEGFGFLTSIINKEDAEIPEGYVISTEPAANTEIRPGEQIIIYVSTGSAYADVPNLVGYDYDEAVLALEARGFKVSKVEADSDEDEGVVIAQSLEPYEEIEKGSEIILTVSNGEPIENTIELPVSIDSKAEGAYLFTTFIGGVNVGTKQVDDISLQNGSVTVLVTATGNQEVAVKVKNLSNAEEVIIAKFSVDFSDKSYELTDFNDDAFEEIGGISESGGVSEFGQPYVINHESGTTSQTFTLDSTRTVSSIVINISHTGSNWEFAKLTANGKYAKAGWFGSGGFQMDGYTSFGADAVTDSSGNLTVTINASLSSIQVDVFDSPSTVTVTVNYS